MSSNFVSRSFGALALVAWLSGCAATQQAPLDAYEVTVRPENSPLGSGTFSESAVVTEKTYRDKFFGSCTASQMTDQNPRGGQVITEQRISCSTAGGSTLAADGLEVLKNASETNGMVCQVVVAAVPVENAQRTGYYNAEYLLNRIGRMPTAGYVVPKTESVTYNGRTVPVASQLCFPATRQQFNVPIGRPGDPK